MPTSPEINTESLPPLPTRLEGYNQKEWMAILREWRPLRSDVFRRRLDCIVDSTPSNILSLRHAVERELDFIHRRGLIGDQSVDAQESYLEVLHASTYPRTMRRPAMRMWGQDHMPNWSSNNTYYSDLAILTYAHTRSLYNFGDVQRCIRSERDALQKLLPSLTGEANATRRRFVERNISYCDDVLKQLSDGEKQLQDVSNNGSQDIPGWRERLQATRKSVETFLLHPSEQHFQSAEAAITAERNFLILAERPAAVRPLVRGRQSQLERDQSDIDELRRGIEICEQGRPYFPGMQERRNATVAAMTQFHNRSTASVRDRVCTAINVELEAFSAVPFETRYADRNAYGPLRAYQEYLLRQLSYFRRIAVVADADLPPEKVPDPSQEPEKKSPEKQEKNPDNKAPENTPEKTPDAKQPSSPLLTEKLRSPKTLEDFHKQFIEGRSMAQLVGGVLGATAVYILLRRFAEGGTNEDGFFKRNGRRVVSVVTHPITVVGATALIIWKFFGGRGGGGGFGSGSGLGGAAGGPAEKGQEKVSAPDKKGDADPNASDKKNEKKKPDVPPSDKKNEEKNQDTKPDAPRPDKKNEDKKIEEKKNEEKKPNARPHNPHRRPDKNPSKNEGKEIEKVLVSIRVLGPYTDPPCDPPRYFCLWGETQPRTAEDIAARVRSLHAEELEFIYEGESSAIPSDHEIMQTAYAGLPRAVDNNYESRLMEEAQQQPNRWFQPSGLLIRCYYQLLPGSSTGTLYSYRMTPEGGRYDRSFFGRLPRRPSGVPAPGLPRSPQFTALQEWIRTNANGRWAAQTSPAGEYYYFDAARNKYFLSWNGVNSTRYLELNSDDWNWDELPGRPEGIPARN